MNLTLTYNINMLVNKFKEVITYMLNNKDFMKLREYFEAVVTLNT